MTKSMQVEDSATKTKKTKKYASKSKCQHSGHLQGYIMIIVTRDTEI